MMTGFERYTKKTRRAMFLEEMEQVVPWAKLCGLIERHYPKPGNGRRPKELEQMLRIYFLQQWFNLADPAVEEALYDSATLRQFAGIDLGSEPVPDETTVCKFRHLLEEHHLARIIHIFEDNKSLLCYKHVVETMFAVTKEASECLTIAQHSVCCSQEFFASL